MLRGMRRRFGLAGKQKGEKGDLFLNMGCFVRGVNLLFCFVLFLLVVLKGTTHTKKRKGSRQVL